MKTMTSAKFVRLVRPGRSDRSSNRTPSPSSSFLKMNNITVIVLFSLFYFVFHFIYGRVQEKHFSK